MSNRKEEKKEGDVDDSDSEEESEDDDDEVDAFGDALAQFGPRKNKTAPAPAAAHAVKPAATHAVKAAALRATSSLRILRCASRATPRVRRDCL